MKKAKETYSFGTHCNRCSKERGSVIVDNDSYFLCIKCMIELVKVLNEWLEKISTK